MKNWLYNNEIFNPKHASMYHGFVYINAYDLLTLGDYRLYVGSKGFHCGENWQTYVGSGDLVQSYKEVFGTDFIERHIAYLAKTEEEMLDIELYLQKKYRAADDPQWLNLVYGDPRRGAQAGDAVRKKMSVSQKKVDRSISNHKGSRAIVINELTIYPSNKAVCDEFGLLHGAISNWIAKRRGLDNLANKKGIFTIRFATPEEQAHIDQYLKELKS